VEQEAEGETGCYRDAEEARINISFPVMGLNVPQWMELADEDMIPGRGCRLDSPGCGPGGNL